METSAAYRDVRVRPDSDLWQGVNRLVDRAPSLAAIRAHRLDLIAHARWRELGQLVPQVLVDEALAQTKRGLATPLLLARIRAACDGPIVLLKGPETSACYPRPALRRYADLDLLVPDAHEVQRALIAAGFVAVGEESVYTGIHHLQPLHLAGFPLTVEIHMQPKWVDGLAPPRVDELLGSAIKSVVPVDGILALPRSTHALTLAAHDWAHIPLGRVLGLVDVAMVREGVPADELRSLAADWGLQRVWRLTSAAIDAVFLGGRRPWPLRMWARNLREARERTVLATHLQRWLAGFSALPPGAALAATARAVAKDFQPVPGEAWSTKLLRTRLALANATSPRSQHDAKVEDALAQRGIERQDLDDEVH